MNGWDRVIAAVIDRRAELGWTQKQLAAEAGVGERTIQNLESGKKPLPVIRARIERALGWEPGEFRRIEAAGEKRPALSPELQERMRDEVGDEMAARLIAHAEHLASGRTSSAEGGPPRESGSTGRRSAG